MRHTLISDSLQEVDELASHFSLDEVYVAKTSIEGIGPHSITYRAEGSTSVTLQWGSNSDLRRGDGAELEETFPFFCNIEVTLDDPWNLSFAETSCGVDTSEWIEAMKPDE
jgi:hypothetical protein